MPARQLKIADYCCRHHQPWPHYGGMADQPTADECRQQHVYKYRNGISLPSFKIIFDVTFHDAALSFLTQRQRASARRRARI